MGQACNGALIACSLSRWSIKDALLLPFFFRSLIADRSDNGDINREGGKGALGEIIGKRFIATSRERREEILKRFHKRAIGKSVIANIRTARRFQRLNIDPPEINEPNATHSKNKKEKSPPKGTLNGNLNL